MELIRAYLDRAGLGSGYRTLLVLGESGRDTRLLYIPTLSVIRIPTKELRGSTSYGMVKPSRTIRKLRQKRAERKRCGLSYAKAAVKEAISRLEELA